MLAHIPRYALSFASIARVDACATKRSFALVNSSVGARSMPATAASPAALSNAWSLNC